MPLEPPTISPDDATLLQQFTATRSPAAFRQLVDRHLPAVHATAQRILRDPHLAEDVTQSVFILLAQRAKKIRPGPLIGWLYQVTHYACANAQRTTRRRQQHEQEAAAMRPSTSTSPTLSDAEALLDPALLSLSTPERNILLLRYTADLPLAEIARLTCLPPETAKKRLHRALSKLRRYFAAQGMLSAAPAALHALTPASSPTFLYLAPTITAAALTPAAATSSASLLIAKGVSHLMLTAKLAKLSLVAALILLTTTAAGITAHQLFAQTRPTPATAHPVAAAPAVADPPPQDTIQCSGSVEDEQGRPFAGAQVRLFMFTTTSGTDGRFTLTLPKDIALDDDYIASSPDGSLLAFKEIRSLKELNSPSALQLVLRPAREFTVNVVDGQGAPVAGAVVAGDLMQTVLGHAISNAQGVAVLRYPADAPQLLDVIAAKPYVGLDYSSFEEKGQPPRPGMLDGNFAGPLTLVLNGARTVNIHVLDDHQQPLPGAHITLKNFQKPGKVYPVELNDHSPFNLFTWTTDAQGNATCAIIPPDAIAPVIGTLPTHIDRKFTFQISKDGYAPRTLPYDPAANKDSFNISMLSPIHIVTRVADAAGNAIVGASVHVLARQTEDSTEPQKYGMTADDGTFAFDGNPNLYYTFIAEKDHAVSPVISRVIPAGVLPEIIDLTLQPAIHIHGHLTAGPGHTPLAHCMVALYMKEQSYLKLPPDQQILPGDAGRLATPILVRAAYTDKDGLYEFYAPPGSYLLSTYDLILNQGRITAADEKFPMPSTQLELVEVPDLEVNLHSDQLPPPASQPK